MERSAVEPSRLENGVCPEEELGLKLPALSVINSLLNQGPQWESECERTSASLDSALADQTPSFNDAHEFLTPFATQSYELDPNNQLSIELQPGFASPTGFPVGELEPQLTPFVAGPNFHPPATTLILSGE